MKKSKVNNENYKERFRQYMAHFKNKDELKKKMIAESMIRIIVEHLNYIAFIKLIEEGYSNFSVNKLNGIYDNLEIELKYRETKDTSSHSNNNLIIISSKVKSFIKIKARKFFCTKQSEENNNKKIVDGIYEGKITDINNIPILLSPSSQRKIISTLTNLDLIKDECDSDQVLKWTKNYYLRPMNIMVCHERVHSHFSLWAKKSGVTKITNISDYRKLYEKIHFDGENYIYDNKEKIVIKEENANKVFYSGVIFELGRFLLEQDED